MIRFARWLPGVVVAGVLAGCAAQEDIPLTNDQIGPHAPTSLQRARFLERRALVDLASYTRTSSAYRRRQLLESAIDYYGEARDTFKLELDQLYQQAVRDSETGLKSLAGLSLREEYLDQELVRIEGLLDLLVRRRELPRRNLRSDF